MQGTIHQPNLVPGQAIIASDGAAGPIASLPIMASWRQKSALLLMVLFAIIVIPSSLKAAKPELWFPVGETITYQASWGGIPVAEARVWTEWVEEDGRDLLAIRVTITTGSIMSKIYPVKDFIESVVEPTTFLPLRFTRNLSEGRYRLHEVTTFDHHALKGHWKHLLKNNEETFAIEPDTRDFLSFMFAMRRTALEAGSNYTYRVMADEKLYDLTVEGLKIETIHLLNYGWVKSLKVEPKATFQGLITRTGRLFMWISLDARRLCTKASISVPVASVKVLLQKVEGPGDDFWTNPGKNPGTLSTHHISTPKSDPP